MNLLDYLCKDVFSVLCVQFLDFLFFVYSSWIFRIVNVGLLELEVPETCCTCSLMKKLRISKRRIQFFSENLLITSVCLLKHEKPK